jgi:hypothetical protein
MDANSRRPAAARIAGVAAALLLLFGIALCCAACSESAPGSASPKSVASAPAPARVRFTDVTKESGVDFVHENGSFGKKWLPETMGSGVAMLDFDGDGMLDLLFVNQRRWPGHEDQYSAKPAGPSTLRLYRNLGNLRFEDVTIKTGLAREICGMGAAAADIDGDGDQDLLVTALGDTLLFRNDGGKFTECARESGIVTSQWTDKSGAAHPAWGTAAAFLDYDRDGVLDVFVATYVKWSEGSDIHTTLDGTTKAFTTPDLYPGDSCRLYRGLGGGKFEDATERAGVFNPNGKSLGVAICDFDRDGWPDIVVANDTQPNFLYRNDRGRFVDIGNEAGVAYDSNGRARAGMGIDAARLGPDDKISIGIGNFSREPLSLFQQKQTWAFADEAGRAGLGAATFLPLTFGLAFADADLDGRLDLLLCNGHIEPTVQSVQPDVSFAQKPQFFWNRGGGAFDDMSQIAGLATPLVGRGLATGDLDGDGDPDLVMTQNGGPAVILRCDREGDAKNHGWLRLKLEGRAPNRDAIGARIRAEFAGRVEEREVRTGSSYLSQSEVSVILGVGTARAIDRLVVEWPWGGSTKLENIVVSEKILVIRP